MEPEEVDDCDKDCSSGCFSADGPMVRSDGDSVSMEQLQVGDVVLTNLVANSFETVIGFTHHDSATETHYITISTAANLTISLTADHFLYKDGGLALASHVAVGDFLNAGDKVLAVVKTRRLGLSCW